MEAVSSRVEKLWGYYKVFVVKHADDLGIMESLLRVLAYLLERKFHDPALIGELLLACLELLRFIHDFILRKALHMTPMSPTGLKGQLKTFLNLIYCSEAFLEVAAGKLCGEYGKWVIIAFLQILKTGIRLWLLWEHRVGLQSFPPISRLDRSQALRDIRTTENTCECAKCSDIRSSFNNSADHSSPHSVPHDVPQSPTVTQHRASTISTENRPVTLTKQRLYAESLYVTKPLVHLLSMSVFGTSSWKPWLISCAADVTSLYVMGDTSDLTKTERVLLKKRSILLVMYLLRSPFYDKFTKRRVINMLNTVASSVPGAHLITEILLEYAAYTQDKYSYIWSY